MARFTPFKKTGFLHTLKCLFFTFSLYFQSPALLLYREMREIVVTEQMNGSESKGQWDDTSEWIKIHEDEQNYSTGDSQLQPSVAVR